MNNMFILPPEVIDMIFSFCDISALLNLRLVSQTFKTILDTSTPFLESLEDIQITIHHSTLARFVDSAPHIPFTNFYIDHSEGPDSSKNTSAIYKVPKFKKFIELFCPHIRKLRVKLMFGCFLDDEFQFFQAMRNLRELHVDTLTLKREDSDSGVSKMTTQARLPFLEQNRMLRRLMVVNGINCEDYLIQLMKRCPLLEVTMVTRFRGDEHNESDSDDSIENPSYYTTPIFRLASEGHLNHLKILDFDWKPIKLDTCSSQDIQFFKEMVSKRKVLMDNVSPLLLHRVLDCSALSPQIKEAFKERIVSCVGYSELLKGKSFLNLRELYFNSSHSWTYEDDYNWDLTDETQILELQNLKTVIAKLPNESNYPAKEFVEWFFNPIEPRVNVKHLDISYSARRMGNRWWNFQPSFLDAGFPNLTRLLLYGEVLQQIKLFDLIEVISRKVLLQELSLGTYEGIPEAAFFGQLNSQTPIFLRLINLKKLRLRCPERKEVGNIHPKKEEKMGNRLMSLLSKMSLTHLKIEGKNWDNVTSSGIRKLTTGPLGRSVLFVRLKSLEDTNEKPHKLSGSLVRLARIAHCNRLAKGLTNSSFEELSAFKETWTGNETCEKYPFMKAEYS